VSHPSLGLPPPDETAGLPDAARRIRERATELAARALSVAIERDPTLRERYDDAGLRARLHDAQLLAERLALCVAADDPTPLREYADWTSPVYRRKQVPLDDLIGLCEGLRAALPLALAPGELWPADAALDTAVAQYKWHRRLAGDARKKNAFLQFLYKGG
jgi:hypothetical protein